MTILVQAATYLMFRASQARRIHTLHTGSGIGCGGDRRDGRGTVHMAEARAAKAKALAALTAYNSRN